MPIYGRFLVPYISYFSLQTKYLSRRIPYASNGSFNPYIITIRKHIWLMEIPHYQRILIAINVHKHSNPNYRNVSLKKYQSHCVVQASHLKNHFRNHCLEGGKGGGLDQVSRKIKRSFHNSRKIK